MNTHITKSPATVSLSFTSGPVGLLQRKCSCGTHALGGQCEACGKKREVLRRSANKEAAAADVPPLVSEVLNAPGHPLDAAARAFFEPRFGRDFGAVRVHTDARAAASARAVSALAYTVGRNVVFGAGQYAPQSRAGQELIAHELTHVTQQEDAAWTGGALGLGAADTTQELEAERVSQRVLAAANHSARAASSAPAGAIQRQEAPDSGSISLRLGEGGRIEVLLGTPDLPITGALGVGFRCQNGRCQPVGGQNPADLSNRTYTVQEALDLLRGGAGTTPSGPACPPDRQIPQFGACCPTGTMWDGGACVPLSSLLCLPSQMTPSGRCCPTGERWDYAARRCTPPAPSGPASAPSSPFTLPPLQGGAARLRFGTIESATFDNFRSDNAAVPAQHSAALDHLASLLNIYREVEVHVEGHTDSTAGEAHNVQLSVARAAALRAALVSRNVVNPGRLRTQGLGERQLRFQPERTNADKAGNRRVEVWFHIPPSQGVGEELRPRTTM